MSWREAIMNGTYDKQCDNLMWGDAKYYVVSTSRTLMRLFLKENS